MTYENIWHGFFVEYYTTLCSRMNKTSTELVEFQS